MLGHAIAGLQATTHDAMAIFAPNLNAYRRFAPNQFVPVNTSWGTNNRSVSFRIPAGGGRRGGSSIASRGPRRTPIS
jgi:glutamine synthetase